METLTGWLEQNIASSPLMAILAALAAGVLISFTPCVYPVLGPTVAFVGARAAGSRVRAFTLSLVYGLGMAIMYAALGAFAALTGRMFGQFTASNPWVQGFIGAVCLLMGLSMLDVFAVQMPSGLQSLYTKRVGGPHVAALAAGAVFALIPASCAAPVLLVILAFVAVGKDVLYGVALLFAFGIGVSVLVVLVGTFAGLLTALPKSGKWMDRIKHGMGWVMVVLGVYFFFSAGRLSQGPEPVIARSEASLSDYRGEVVLLTFWASWCQACMEEVPELRRLYEKYHDQGLEVVAVNGQERPGLAAETAKNMDMPYTVLLGPEGADVWSKYRVLGLPLNVLIDRSGVIVYHAGAIPADTDEQIARLLAEKGGEPDPSLQVGDEVGMVAPDFTLPTAQAAAGLEGAAEPTHGDEVGRMAPEFTLPAVDGTEISLADWRGRVVLMHFCSSYDSGEDAEPELRRLYRRYHDDGLEVVGVNVGDDRLAVEARARERALPYPLLVGIDSPDLPRQYDTLHTPLLILVDRSGVIAYRGAALPGDLDERIAQLLEADAS